MLLTEDEAKKKYCVMSGANPQTGEIFCTGSNCMAWRWKAEFEIKTKQTPRKRTLVNILSLERMLRPELIFAEVEPKRGYCGVARKPEQASRPII